MMLSPNTLIKPIDKLKFSDQIISKADSININV